MGERLREVDEYITMLPAERREALTALRKLIHCSVPLARETMDYKMPTFVVGVAPVCSMASQSRHLALYICNPAVMDRHRKALAHLDLGKGCIRFKRLEDLPIEAVEKLLREVARTTGARN
jgi:uncharacterized protein YdhG (YjbR/CyaY superfamily)